MKHTVRGVVTAWLGLVALQAVSKAGSGRVPSFFADVDQLVQRALSPNVPAIPDRRSAAGTYDSDGNFHPSIPGYLGGGTTTAPGSGTSGQKSNPNYVPYDPAPTGRNNPQYSNPHPNQPGGILE